MDTLLTIIVLIVSLLFLVFIVYSLYLLNDYIYQKYKNYYINIWFWFVVASLILPIFWYYDVFTEIIFWIWLNLFIICFCLTLGIFTNIFKKIYNKFK